MQGGFDIQFRSQSFVPWQGFPLVILIGRGDASGRARIEDGCPLEVRACKL